MTSVKKPREKTTPLPRPEGFSVVPKDEHSCLWMMAGIISYKLCRRDYECDSCPLDMEMGQRSKPVQGEEKANEFPEEGVK